MKKQFQLFVFSAFVLLTQINYAQINLSTDRTIYNPDKSISVSFSNGPGNPMDWIGIYKVGDVPGVVEATLWNYVNGTQTASGSIKEGSVIFPFGLQTEGNYWVGLFENDSYNTLIVDSFKVIDDGLPRVTTDKKVYNIADSITVFFKHGPNNPTDWIGIYKFGDIPGPSPSILWLYVDGTQSSSVGIRDGSVTFTEGLVDTGMYWARFLANDGYTVLDSSSFKVNNLNDSIAPAAPAGITVITSTFYNLVTWVDVPGEFNEMYSVYASVNPITNVEAKGVELIKSGIGENIQVFEHVLNSANIDRVRTYYYAVSCKDLAGNVGNAGTYGPVTNTARGVPTIAITPPSPFVADGDLSEWAAITPFTMQSALGTANVPANSIVDGDNDLSAQIKLAVDNSYLYVMMDVTDDAYYHPKSLAPWERDEPDLYIGLYNLTKAHTAYGTGATADYQIRFDEDRIRLDAATDDSLFIPIGENYFHDGGTTKIVPGYLLEARIPLVDLTTKRQLGQTANDTINWKVGDRIPFTIGINDNDNGITRTGMIFYSQQSQEQAYYDVSSWTYTWISDELTGVDDNSAVVNAYDLKQNYPNPFNPSTKIQYSVAEPGLVSIKVFDILGNQIAELMNGYQSAGNYKIDFPSSNMKLASGVYLYELRAGDYVRVKKMLLMK